MHKKTLSLTIMLSVLFCFAVMPVINFANGTEPVNKRQSNTKSFVDKEVPKTSVTQDNQVFLKIQNDVSKLKKQILDNKIDEICKNHGVIGMNVAAFSDGRIVYDHFNGAASLENDSAVTKETKYRIASTSKLVTTMLALMLEQDGKLSIDGDLRDIMPIPQNPYYKDSSITTRQLIMHTSGLHDGDGYSKSLGSSTFLSLSEVFNSDGMFNGSKPGESYDYSNFGAGLVAGAIESVTGERFSLYAKKVLFDPLVADASYSTDGISAKKEIASIYTQDHKLQMGPDNWRDSAINFAKIPVGQMYLMGHGNLIISADDLAKIGIILAGDGTYNGKRYLTDESLSQINSIIMHDDKSNSDRGLGTFAYKNLMPDAVIYGHQGNAYGMISCLLYNPENNSGIVFLSNSCDDSKDEDGLYDINREIFLAVYPYL